MLRVSLRSLVVGLLLAAAGARAAPAPAPAVICASEKSPLTLWDATGAKVGTFAGPPPPGKVEALAMAMSTAVVVLDNGEVQSLEPGQQWFKADTLQAHGAVWVPRANTRRTSAYFFTSDSEGETFNGALTVDRHGRTFWADPDDIFRVPDRTNPVDPQGQLEVLPPAVAKAAKVEAGTKAEWTERTPWGAKLYAFDGAAEGDLPPPPELWMVPEGGSPVNLGGGDKKLSYRGFLNFGATFALYQETGRHPGSARLLLPDGKVVKVGPEKSPRCALYTGAAPKAAKKGAR